MKYEMIFESDKILYIKVNEHLVKDYLDMVNDIDVQKCISHNIRKYTIEDEKKWIKEKIANNELVFSMLEKNTNNFIGNIEIININNNIGELDIALTPAMQNKHYGTEALNKIIEYAKDILKLDGLDLNVYSFNNRAKHCYEKVGFIEFGKGTKEDDIHMILKFK